MKSAKSVLTRLLAPLSGVLLLITLAFDATVTGSVNSRKSERSAVAASEEVFVPAGPFSMGCAPDYSYAGFCDKDSMPIHTVYVDAFYIDRTEVTNAQYRVCVAMGACPPPLANSSATRSDYYTNPLYDNYPVIQVDWYRAYGYCRWAGKRLPTEAEWEKAARGTDLRLFPWGNSALTCDRTNYESCVGDTVAVGSYPAGVSPYGALDMIGNVSEWVNDFYESPYYQTSPYYNPRGPDGTLGDEHLLRGGSWAEDANTYVRLDGSDTYHYPSLGIRCARSATGPTPTPLPPTPTSTPIPPTPTPTPFAASAIGPGGGALWLASPEHLTLLNVSPGIIDANRVFSLTVDGRSNVQGDLQGIDHFFSLEAGNPILLSAPTSLITPVRLFVGFANSGGLISNTTDLYRLEAGGWVTSGVTVTERTAGYIVAWVDGTGTYGVLGKTNRTFLPVVLRGY